MYFCTIWIILSHVLHDFPHGCFFLTNPVLKVVHDAGGRVFSLMCDDLSVNQKTYKMFYEVYESLGISSVVHPHKNSKFDALYLLHDLKRTKCSMKCMRV